MRRAIVGLAATALTLLALAGPASAAKAQVTRVRLTELAANAVWLTTAANSGTATNLGLFRSKQSGSGMGLFVQQFTDYFDANGNYAGETDTFVTVYSGFSWSLKQPIAAATVTGSGVPATSCQYDANFNLIGCTQTTIDLSVTWTGQGPITHAVVNEHFKNGHFDEHIHDNGKYRNATATGTVAGVSLPARDLNFGNLYDDKSAIMTTCVGSTC